MSNMEKLPQLTAREVGAMLEELIGEHNKLIKRLAQDERYYGSNYVEERSCLVS